MDSVMGFLVTLGIIGASTGEPETPPEPEPTVQAQMAAESGAGSLEARRRRIELTNEWLRSGRQIDAKPRAIVATKD